MSDREYRVDSSVRSSLLLEWTNDMGCGTNDGGDNAQDRVNCNAVVQYMCRPPNDDLDDMRDGFSHRTQGYKGVGRNEGVPQFAKRKQEHVKMGRGLHETFEEYDKCAHRARNLGR